MRASNFKMRHLEDTENARSEPVMPLMKLAATLLLIHAVRVSSKGEQPSQELKGEHVDVCYFSVWSGN